MRKFLKLFRFTLFILSLILIFWSVILEYSDNTTDSFFCFLLFLSGYFFMLLGDEIKAIIKYKASGKYRVLLTLPLKHTAISIVAGGMRLFNPFHTLLCLSIFVLAWLLFLINGITIDFLKVKARLKKHRFFGKVFTIFYLIIRINLVFLGVSIVVFLSYPGNISAVSSNVSWWLRNGATPVIKWEDVDMDMEMVAIYIDGLEEVASKIEDQSDLFQSDFSTLSPEEKNVILGMWASYMDYAMNVDYVQRRYYFNLNRNPNWTEDEWFKIRILAYSGLISNYKNICRVNFVVSGNYDVISILNEENEEYSIIDNGFLRMKQEAVSFISLVNFNDDLYKLNDILSTNPNKRDEKEIPLIDYIKRNYEAINSSSPLVGDTFLEQVDSLVTKIWAPAQKTILKLATGVEYGPRKIKLIKDNEIEAIKEILKPGDILLKRSNWQLTNVGIPGFWTHSGIYIGDLKDIDSYFAGETDFYGVLPSEYIKMHYPKIYRKLLEPGKYIIESVAEGVVVNPLENIARVDYFAALRPEINEYNKFKALVRAFDFYGAPYDYDLNFLTDKELICSELIYKSYSMPENGLHFKLGEKNGLPLLTPNDIVKEFDREYESKDQELNLVVFRDAYEWSRKSFTGSVEEFRNSWKRSKWDFLRD